MPSMDTEKPYEDRALFKRLYLDEQKTQEELAAIFQCSKPTVNNWIKKHGLQKNRRGGSKRNLTAASAGTGSAPVGSGSAAEMISILAAWDSMPPQARKALKATLKQMVDRL